MTSKDLLRDLAPFLEHGYSVAEDREINQLDLALSVGDVELFVAILERLYDRAALLGCPPAPPAVAVHEPLDEWTEWRLQHGERWDAWQRYPLDRTY